MRIVGKIVSALFYVSFVLLLLLIVLGIAFEIIDAPIIENALGKIGISDPYLFFYVATPIVIAITFASHFIMRKLK